MDVHMLNTENNTITRTIDEHESGAQPKATVPHSHSVCDRELQSANCGWHTCATTRHSRLRDLPKTCDFSEWATDRLRGDHDALKGQR